MRGRETEPDPYWSDDVLLGEILWPEGAALVRLRLHQSEEAYHGRTIAELIPLSQPAGTRPSGWSPTGHGGSASPRSSKHHSLS